MSLSSTATPIRTSGTKKSLSRFSIAAFSCLVMSGLLPWTGTADITCAQSGSNTIHVGSTVKFAWNDTASYPIDTFQLDLYCIENSQFMQTLSTLNTTGSVSPQTWVVNQTILAQASLCRFNQYRGRFVWNYTDPTTGVLTPGFADCKSMLLIGPGVVSPPGGANPDPSQDLPPEDTDNSGPIIVTDKTKTIVIGVGCAVGALVLAGFIGFYYIRFSNKRAVQAQISKKLREPLSGSPYGGNGSHGGSTIAVGAVVGGGSGLFARESGTRYNELSSVTASIAGYSPVHQNQQQLHMVELNNRPYSDHDGGSMSSRPQTPIAAAHSGSSILGSSASQHQSSPLLGPRPSSLLPSVQDRPTSLLTSSFTPPPEPRSHSYQQRQQGEAGYGQRQ